MAERIQIEVTTSDLGQKFKRLMFSDRNFRANFIKLVRQQLQKARNNTVKDIKQFVGNGYRNSHGDPRQAFRAIKFSLYKDGTGGNISLFNKRRASQQRVNLNRERKIDQNPHQRGGNRVKRNEKSKASTLDSYWGSDRSFILRFLNVGTDNRESRYGNRGSIPGRSSFAAISTWHIKTAADEIEKQVAEAMGEIWKD